VSESFGQGSFSGRFYGKYRGIVTNNDDPKKLGRIRVKVPEVLGDAETGFALPCVPYAGPGMGIFAVPPSGAGIWVEFEAGDPSKPIWSGCWWGEGQLPKDESGSQVEIKQKIFSSDSGLMVVLNDEKQSIAISDKNGKNLLKIEISEGKASLNASTKVILQAPQIELVENSPHPLVFGDSLLTYLSQMTQIYQSHIHPGQTAGPFPVTPAPPMQFMNPPAPDLLSSKVKTG